MRNVTSEKIAWLQFSSAQMFTFLAGGVVYYF